MNHNDSQKSLQNFKNYSLVNWDPDEHSKLVDALNMQNRRGYSRPRNMNPNVKINRKQAIRRNSPFMHIYDETQKQKSKNMSNLRQRRKNREVMVHIGDISPEPSEEFL